ncbi:MAG: DUF6056 family protein [Muribaculaceae bacterium]
MMNNLSKPSKGIAAIAIIVGCCTAWVAFFTPFSGDDWVYFDAASNRNFFGWLTNGFGHWLTTNGRLANIGFTPLLLLPKCLLALICGAFASLLYYEAARACNAASHLGGFAAIFCLLSLALPWWDSMWMFDCQFNYVFAAGMCLWAMRMIFNQPKSNGLRLLAAVGCFAAGMMHEAASLPLCIGIMVYLLAGGKRPSWLLAAAFALGTAAVTFSPGIWMRATSGHTPDDSVWMLLIKSDLAAAIVAIGLLVGVTVRYFALRRFLATSYGIFAIAAVVSMCISLASGIVGRSGWFAEIYAFIVILAICSQWLTHIPAIVSWLVITISILPLATAMIFQPTAAREYQEYEQAYAQSHDGVVFIDYTHDDEWPTLALNRIRGVLDPDDCYLHICLAKHYETDKPLPMVLPTEAQGIDKDSILTCGDIISTTLPSDAATRPDGLILCRRDGREWVVQPYNRGGHQLYHLSPRQLAPGDR